MENCAERRKHWREKMRAGGKLLRSSVSSSPHSAQIGARPVLQRARMNFLTVFSKRFSIGEALLDTEGEADWMHNSAPRPLVASLGYTLCQVLLRNMS